jgi:glucokinase
MSAEKTPIEDLRKSALEHYEEASNSIHSWYSDIPKAINFYYDAEYAKEAKQEEVKPPYACPSQSDKCSYPNCSCEWNLDQLQQDNGLREAAELDIINAFEAGRKAGAIFGTQKDNEGLAQQYLKDLNSKEHLNDKPYK